MKRQLLAVRLKQSAETRGFDSRAVVHCPLNTVKPMYYVLLSNMIIIEFLLFGAVDFEIVIKSMHGGSGL